MLFAIIKKELLLVCRDMHSLAVLFLMPMAFILIMSLSLQGTFDKEKDKGRELSVGLVLPPVNNREVPLGKALQKMHNFYIKTYKNYQSMTSAMQPDHLVAGLVLPSMLGPSIKQNRKIDKADRLQIYYAATTPDYIRQLIFVSANHVVVSFQLDKLLSSMIPDPLEREAQKERLLGTRLLEEREWGGQQQAVLATGNDASELSTGKPSAVQQSVPAWLIFSMFFVVIPITMTFLVEKQLGTMQRLKTMPVPSSFLLIGKLVPYLGVNLLQALLMFLVGIYLVPAIGGEGLVLSGNAWLLLPMTISVSLAAISFALFIATIVRSTEQATTIGGTSNLLLGAIGGVMVPTFVMPVLMQDVAKLSPMNWGLEGFLTIMLKHGDFFSIVPEMTRLVVFALIFFVLAIILYRRTTVV